MATTSLGRYDLLGPLGRGGMAEVWRAKARGASRFTRDVAVKVMLPEYATDPEVVAMFIDEACIAAKLEHPNIVQTHDFGKVGERYFIVLELIEGVSLRALAKLEPLSLHESIHVVCEMAAALDYAYDAPGDDGTPLRLVHRDVNPSNIMVTVRGAIKLADFGIAKTKMSTSVTVAGNLKGKIQYMSPEQALGGEIDARTDIYALGLTLYELLANRRAIRGKDEIEALEHARRGGIEPLGPPVDPAIAAIVARALEHDPDARFATAGELRSALLPFLAGVIPADLQTRLAARAAELVAIDRRLVPLAAAPAVAMSEDHTQPATRDDVRSSPSASSTPSSSATDPSPVARASRIPVMLGAVALLGGSMIVGWRVARHGETPIAVTAIETAVVPAPSTPAPVAATPVIVAPSAIAAPAKPVTHALAKVRSNEPATLRIKANPWAEISVDGTDVGMTPLRPLELASGKHQIVAVNPEHGTKRVSVLLSGGERKLVQIAFDGPNATR